MSRIEQIIQDHSDEIEAIKSGLAMNFDAPAQRIINAGFTRMGIARFDASGDVWEQIVCHQNGWEYERPSQELQQRWASY
jgi:hypothetical protein